MKGALAICLITLTLLTFLNCTYAGEVKGMKAVMIIASSNFRDEELFQPEEVLEEGGIKVVIASSSLSPSRGVLGRTARPEVLLTDVKAIDYDAIIFVGGGGAQEYWDNPTAHRIAKEAVSSNKVLGAICIAPVTLANAGVLKGRRATVWSSEAGKLREKGVSYTKSNVEVDGNIVTASGPHAAREFGEAILGLLRKK